MLDFFKNSRKEKSNKARNIKVIFLIIIALLIIIGGIKGIKEVLFKLPAFNIERIILEGSSLTTEEVAKFCDIDLPVNIFEINLDEVAIDIKRLHPEIEDVFVKRRLPDTLLISIERRKPVAEIKVQDRFYQVDKDGFILPGYSTDSSLELPEIVGLRESIILRSLLKECNSDRLHYALRILKSLKENGIVKSHKVSRIDVSNLRSIIFILDNKVEVKVKRDDYERSIKVLGESLPSIDLDEVEYIDLRFEDVVIGTR